MIAIWPDIGRLHMHHGLLPPRDPAPYPWPGPDHAGTAVAILQTTGIRVLDPAGGCGPSRPGARLKQQLPVRPAMRVPSTTIGRSAVPRRPVTHRHNPPNRKP